MQRLFAGWRMKYVKAAHRESGKGRCLFCRLARPGDDAARWILRRRRHAFLVLNAFPYNSGHVLVAVGRHVGSLGGLTAAERKDLLDLAALAEAALRHAYGPDGMNLGVNLGRAAGAGVDGHLHLHLVPRWSGDTNFMTTVGESKVLPEDLTDSYDRLRRAMAAAPRRTKPKPTGRTKRVAPRS